MPSLLQVIQGRIHRMRARKGPATISVRIISLFPPSYIAYRCISHSDSIAGCYLQKLRNLWVPLQAHVSGKVIITCPLVEISSEERPHECVQVHRSKFWSTLGRHSREVPRSWDPVLVTWQRLDHNHLARRRHSMYLLSLLCLSYRDFESRRCLAFSLPSQLSFTGIIPILQK
jgi:hypothetical protein